jgi:hypothetical protein
MLDFFDLKSKKPPFAHSAVLHVLKNPLSSPAALPVGSITAAQQAMFHDVYGTACRITSPGKCEGL